MASKPPPRKRKKFDRSIVDGALPSAVWKLAWPTMLQNVIGGLQGLVDHIMVGNYVGFTGNAAIGVSWQIYLVVVVFISSLFTGMGVLVARFTGADEPEKVNKTVYQSFITALGLAVLFMAPVGYFAAPHLLELVNAEAAVQAEALPYLRIMFVFAFGNLMFFMLSGALRSAGDAQTPLRLGVAMTILNIVLNVVLIAGIGPIPAFGTAGAAMGSVLSGWIVAAYALWRLFGGGWVVVFEKGMGWLPDFTVIRELFRFGLPTGIQGVAMNMSGVILLRFIGSLSQSAEAQAVYSLTYTQLFSFITWSSVGLLGATAAVAGQNLGAKQTQRAEKAPRVAARIGVGVAIFVGTFFILLPEQLLGLFGMEDPTVLVLGTQLLRYLAVSGLFVTVALTYTGALQGTGDTKSPLYISIVSQAVVPLGMCWIIDTFYHLQPSDIWLAIVLGHMTRAVLSVAVFKRGKWKDIQVSLSDDDPPTPGAATA